MTPFVRSVSSTSGLNSRPSWISLTRTFAFDELRDEIVHILASA
jgi:hypothetical protein